MTSIWIIIGVVLGLLVMIPVLERTNKHVDQTKMMRLSRFLLPLVMLSIVIRIIYELVQG